MLEQVRGETQGEDGGTRTRIPSAHTTEYLLRSVEGGGGFIGEKERDRNRRARGEKQASTLTHYLPIPERKSWHGFAEEGNHACSTMQPLKQVPTYKRPLPPWCRLTYWRADWAGPVFPGRLEPA